MPRPFSFRIGLASVSKFKTGVYAIEHVASGKAYVGSSFDVFGRWKSHRHMLRNGRHHSRRLQRSWTKHGEGSFVFRVLLWCDKEHRFEYEQMCIDAMNSYTEGLNGAPFAGSHRDVRHTPESRAKLSKAGKGRPHSESHKKAISEALKGNKNAEGRTLTDAHISALRERMMGNQYTKGKKLPAFFSAKLSTRNIGNTYGAANKGVPKSEKAKASMSIGQKRRWENWRAMKAGADI